MQQISVGTTAMMMSIRHNGFLRTMKAHFVIDDTSEGSDHWFTAVKVSWLSLRTMLVCPSSTKVVPLVSRNRRNEHGLRSFFQGKNHYIRGYVFIWFFYLFSCFITYNQIVSGHFTYLLCWLKNKTTFLMHDILSYTILLFVCVDRSVAQSR